MARRDIITIGTSAGGIEALKTVVAGFPEDLAAAVIVVMHLPPGGRSFLPQVLAESGPLPVTETIDGEPLRPGHVYVAPADSHLLLAEDTLRLTRGPKEGRQRPSINVTFRSAAMSYNERVIGVILTGMLDDGTAGLWEIKRRGGVAVVQDPDEAVFPSMPSSALQDVDVDHRARLSEMGPLLVRLTREALPDTVNGPGERRPSRFSGLTCPECHGPLWERPLGNQTEYRCRVGHAFSSRALLQEQGVTQERKLYEAIVALEEGAEMSEYLAARADAEMRTRLIGEAEQLRQHSKDLRRIIEMHTTISLD
jgi:two-component system chemotaxis response regulator CheB